MAIDHKDFVYTGIPTRVIFGFGTIARVAEEARRLGINRPFVLSGPQQEQQARILTQSLGIDVAGTFTGAAMHTPINVTERALERLSNAKSDGLISLGGGSATGLGKALALRTDLPQLVLPTTYAGSEMTSLLGETSGGKKTTQRSQKVQPEAVIYDVNLTLTLPAGLSATSGVNAMAHAVEGLYARDRNPMISLFAREAIRSLAEALPIIVDRPDDCPAREKALYGACLCGIVLGSVEMGLHHKICHILGGTCDLPHSETHTIILPHVVSLNAIAARNELASLIESFANPNPGQGIYDFLRGLRAPVALKDIGMPAKDLDAVADSIAESSFSNPCPYTRTQIRRLLDDAFHGRRPEH